MSITLRMQALIQEETIYGQFNDALYFTQEEAFDKDGRLILDLQDVESKAAERVGNWATDQEAAKNAPPPKESTTDEKLAEQFLAFLQTDEGLVEAKAYLADKETIADIEATKAVELIVDPKLDGVIDEVAKRPHWRR